MAGAIACITPTPTTTPFPLNRIWFRPAVNNQKWDKLLDTWYLCFLFAASRRWTSALARRTVAVLLAWRLVGVAIFEATGWRQVLVLTPNIFENFYLFWAMALKWFPFRLTGRRLALILIAVGIPKLYQEAAMHWLAPDQQIRAPFLNFIERFW